MTFTVIINFIKIDTLIQWLQMCQTILHAKDVRHTQTRHAKRNHQVSTPTFPLWTTFHQHTLKHIAYSLRGRRERSLRTQPLLTSSSTSAAATASTASAPARSLSTAWWASTESLYAWRPPATGGFVSNTLYRSPASVIEWKVLHD